jgi:hypothetical protein
MSIDDKLFKLMFDDNFHICMIYGIEIKSNQIKPHQCVTSLKEAENKYDEKIYCTNVR